MLGNELKDLVPRDERGVKIDDALNNVRIRNRQIDTAAAEVPAQIADRDPVAQVGFVPPDARHQLSNRPLFFLSRGASDQLSDDERWQDEQVVHQRQIDRINSTAVNVIDDDGGISDDDHEAHPRRYPDGSSLSTS
ncbi:MAG TPA: hypothetical protein VHX14_08250, partial [Thermoanaerobaculia bacterium]|nr:hypothetical protein [Thermoanaerobaculia bacterium]